MTAREVGNITLTSRITNHSRRMLQMSDMDKAGRSVSDCTGAGRLCNDSAPAQDR
jgi:hypothetical protein